MTEREREYQRLIGPIEDRMMRSIWRVLRDPQDTEDAFQAALLTLWARWERIVEHPNPRALVLHICLNAARDVQRARLRQGGEQAAPAERAASTEQADEALNALDHLASDERHAEVYAAIGALPEPQGQVLLLHVVEGLPYREIATALRCGEAAARKHAERARTRLRALLSHLMPAQSQKESSHA